VVRRWQSERQLLHGYLCFADADEARLAAWTKNITDFALRSGYQPGSIFMDCEASPGGMARGGFIQLLGVLHLPDAFGVVVPTLTHLSNETFVQQTLVHMVQLTDSQLLVASAADGSNPTTHWPVVSKAVS
jgi:hypothetical protein